MPKHVELTAHALHIIADASNPGIKSAPFVQGPDGWSHKLFSGSIAEHIVHKENSSTNDRRSTVSRASIAVATVIARIVEEANAMKHAEPERFRDAKLLMQGSRDDAGWSKATTRGSGVLMNQAGKCLFAAATAQMKARFD